MSSAVLPVTGRPYRRFSRLVAAVLVLLLHFLPPAFAAAPAAVGRCVGVSDGDTVTLLMEGGPEKVRLYGIDAPEKVQPFGQKAKQYASSIVYGREALLERLGTDRYGRTIGRVAVGGRSLNEEMLRAGLAWHYRAYSNDPRLAALESEARRARRGLWADPAPVPPWSFRREKRLAGSGRFSQPPSLPSNVRSSSLEPYRGNTASHLFHKAGCRNFDAPNCTAGFGSRASAIAAGYRPCRICRP
ncbi:MAG: thermonuclease family protein [Chlorobiaceae bacterium]|nr:thermonuclease family protein [Chlorobiaceae bacterium]